METNVERNLASALKTLRETRGLSVERAAVKAAIAPSTLRRWECGAKQPQISSLFPVLEALKASEHEKNAVLLLLDAPRGIAACRRALAEEDDLGDCMPASGDLWRAMRMRSGMSGKQLADCVHVHASHISRIEHSLLVPEAELRARLFAVLGASDEEQRVLSSRNMRLGKSSDAVSLDGLEQQLQQLRQQPVRGAKIPADLFFLHLEAQL